VAQKVLKYSKIAQNSILGLFQSVLSFLSKFFSKDKYDLGRASVIKHKIKMRYGQPLHARQFRFLLLTKRLFLIMWTSC
jgi:hypothetical protein